MATLKAKSIVAGSNVNISDNGTTLTIGATNTTYTAGIGLVKSGSQFSMLADWSATRYSSPGLKITNYVRKDYAGVSCIEGFLSHLTTESHNDQDTWNVNLEDRAAGVKGITNRKYCYGAMAINYSEIQGSLAFYAKGYHGILGVGTSIGVKGNGGTYDFYALGDGTNYGPFTGGHDAIIAKNTNIQPGDIVVMDNIVNRANISNTIGEVKLPSISKEPQVFGVFVKVSDTLPEHIAALPDNFDLTGYDHCVVNALGEGLMRVCGEGGDIVAGDYICTSSTPGKGMKQDDDLFHNYTVAKALEAVSFVGTEDFKLIAVTYHCG